MNTRNKLLYVYDGTAQETRVLTPEGNPLPGITTVKADTSTGAFNSMDLTIELFDMMCEFYQQHVSCHLANETRDMLMKMPALVILRLAEDMIRVAHEKRDLEIAEGLVIGDGSWADGWEDRSRLPKNLMSG